MTAGRAMEHDALDPRERRRRARQVNLVWFGAATVVIGLILMAAASWNGPVVRSHGLVPEMVVGLQTIGLGGSAILIAKRHLIRGWTRASTLLLLSVLVIGTLTTVQIALDVAVRPFGFIGVLCVAFSFFIPILTPITAACDRLIQRFEERRARGRST